MPPSTPKRRRPLGGAAAASPRTRKKQKRLDAICDVAPPPPPCGGGGDGQDSDAEAVRRSTRLRRPPATLDTSPAASPRRKRPRRGGSSGGSRKGGRARGEAAARLVEEEEEGEDEEDGGGNAAWRSRLRDRAKGKAGARRRARSLWLEDEDGEEDGARTVAVGVREGTKEEEGGEESSRGRGVREGEISLTIDLTVETPKVVTVVEEEVGEEDDGDEDVEDEEEEATGAGTDLAQGNVEEVVEEGSLPGAPVQLEGENDNELASDENANKAESGDSGENEQLGVHHGQIAEVSNLPDEMELDGPGPGEQVEEVQQDEQMDDAPNIALSGEALDGRAGKSLVSDEIEEVWKLKKGGGAGYVEEGLMGDHLGSHCMILPTARMKPTRVLCLRRTQTMMYVMDSVKILDGLDGYWVQYMIDSGLPVSGFTRIVRFGVLRFTLLVWGA